MLGLIQIEVNFSLSGTCSWGTNAHPTNSLVSVADFVFNTKILVMYYPCSTDSTVHFIHRDQFLALVLLTLFSHHWFCHVANAHPTNSLVSVADFVFNTKMCDALPLQYPFNCSLHPPRPVFGTGFEHPVFTSLVLPCGIQCHLDFLHLFLSRGIRCHLVQLVI